MATAIPSGTNDPYGSQPTPTLARGTESEDAASGEFMRKEASWSALKKNREEASRRQIFQIGIGLGAVKGKRFGVAMVSLFSLCSLTLYSMYARQKSMVRTTLLLTLLYR